MCSLISPLDGEDFVHVELGEAHFKKPVPVGGIRYDALTRELDMRSSEGTEAFEIERGENSGAIYPARL
ncbi:MAG: hypothetical protein U9Q79_06645 [Candidatus Hydrogenedentes bacterium]|nr:hypothetical protein [Candidatus Hydrogenedentota bacterium]